MSFGCQGWSRNTVSWKVVQGTAAPWCRKAPHPLYFPPHFPSFSVPACCYSTFGAYPALVSQEQEAVQVCPESLATWVSSSSGACSPAASFPHPSPSSSPAPHTLPHVSAPPHPPAAPGSTRGPGGDGGVSATICSRAGAAPQGLWYQPTSSLARPAHTRWRKRGFSARLRSWADTALTTLLLPSTRSKLSAFSPSFFRRPSGMRFKARSTTSWSSELRFCASSAAGSNQRCGESHGIAPIPLPPIPGHLGSMLGRVGPMQGANAWNCSPRHWGPTARIWEGSMGLGCTLDQTDLPTPKMAEPLLMP